MKNLENPNKVQELQRKLYLKSKKEKNFKFYSLYDKVYRMDVLEVALKKIKANKGAPGIDGERIEDIKDEEKYLVEIQEELKAEKYKAKAVKRVWIPKRNGKLRALGIPTVKDRVIQMAVKIIIEPIFEAEFQECSYGYRPNKSAHQAVGEIKKYLNWGLVNVADVDITDFFGTIEHEKLIKMIRRKIIDRKILRLIKNWLRSGILEEGEESKGNRTGTPQGGVISPLLANIYLNEVDRYWKESGNEERKKLNAQIIRYADDLVIMTNKGLGKPLKILEEKLEELGLKLSKEKTKVVSADRGDFDFLGFNFRMIWNKGKTKKFPLMVPSQRAVKEMIAKIREVTKISPVKIEEIVKNLNKILIGWRNYFRIGNSSRIFHKIQNNTVKKIRRYLRKKQGKCGYGWKEIPSKYLYGKLGLSYNQKVSWAPVK